MTMQFNRDVFAEAVKIETPKHGERAFGLHPALHIATIGGYFTFLGVMWAAFGEAPLALPFVIFVVTLAAGFIVPGLWAGVAGDAAPKDDWAAFRRKGFDCATGHVTAGAAMAQVLILPMLLVCWAIAIAIIHATV